MRFGLVALASVLMKQCITLKRTQQAWHKINQHRNFIPIFKWPVWLYAGAMLRSVSGFLLDQTMLIVWFHEESDFLLMAFDKVTTRLWVLSWQWNVRRWLVSDTRTGVFTSSWWSTIKHGFYPNLCHRTSHKQHVEKDLL